MDYIKMIRPLVGHQRIILNAAGAIITREDGKILLQRRSDNGNWSLIGGLMELDETCARYTRPASCPGNPESMKNPWSCVFLIQRICLSCPLRIIRMR